MPVAQIVRIAQEDGVVGAHVDAYGQAMPGVDSGRGAIQRKLAHGNSHPPGPLVPQAQNPLVVGGHDQPDIRLGGVAQQGRDAAHVVRGNPDPARPPNNVAIDLAGFAHRRRVHDGQQFHEVFHQETIKERLIAVLESRQADELLQVVAFGSQVFSFQGDLLFDRQDRRGHQAQKSQFLSLPWRESRPLVVHRVA